MDYTYADQTLALSQPFLPQADDLFSITNDVDGFSHEDILNNHLNPSQTEPTLWSHDSLPFDPTVLSYNALDALTRAPQSEVEASTFQSAVPTAYHAPNDLNTWEMANESILPTLPAEMAQQEPPLKCPQLGCDNERIYSTISSFHKHQGKHTRPYACNHGSCTVRPFGDKAGLTRHYREVHGSKVHYCPFRSCIRHTRGFARNYNLLQHQMHCHGDQALSRGHGASERPSMEPLEHDDELTELVQSPSESTECGLEAHSVAERSCANLGGEDRLERRLRALKAKRARINREITTLESARALVGANSS